MASDQRMFGIKKWKAHIIWYHNFTEFHLIFDSISSPNVHMKHLLDTLDHHNHGTLPDGTILPRKTPSPWPRGPLHPRPWPHRWLGRWNATPIFTREVMGRCSGNSLEMVISYYFPTFSQHFPKDDRFGGEPGLWRQWSACEEWKASSSNSKTAGLAKGDRLATPRNLKKGPVGEINRGSKRGTTVFHDRNHLKIQFWGVEFSWFQPHGRRYIRPAGRQGLW